ncbi:hypothetical protein B484DRAFT_443013 [Ochromonadaceae sp. CCMP2298]|nr:hypothetical protein B484DRAFT_443013 [Ochromonadaceae sp. CCMP2298]
MMNLLQHGHLLNYGGGYYSYLFAKMHAAQIWHTHFAQDPLNRAAGQFLRSELLEPGSSRPAARMLAAVGGGGKGGLGGGGKGGLDPSFYLRSVLGDE